MAIIRCIRCDAVLNSTDKFCRYCGGKPNPKLSDVDWD